jgi:uncharacterized membrane protein
MILVIMLALDSVYLYSTKSIFGQMVAKIQRTALEFKMVGAIIVYLLLAFGLYVFIIEPKKSLWHAALLGLVIYGVYDFTSYAILKKYDLNVAIMDTVWGATLMTATTYVFRALV